MCKPSQLLSPPKHQTHAVPHSWICPFFTQKTNPLLWNVVMSCCSLPQQGILFYFFFKVLSEFSFPWRHHHSTPTISHTCSPGYLAALILLLPARLFLCYARLSSKFSQTDLPVADSARPCFCLQLCPWISKPETFVEEESSFEFSLFSRNKAPFLRKLILTCFCVLHLVPKYPGFTLKHAKVTMLHSKKCNKEICTAAHSFYIHLKSTQFINNHKKKKIYHCMHLSHQMFRSL